MTIDAVQCGPKGGICFPKKAGSDLNVNEMQVKYVKCSGKCEISRTKIDDFYRNTQFVHNLNGNRISKISLEGAKTMVQDVVLQEIVILDEV